jgi:hypothetical protein
VLHVGELHAQAVRPGVASAEVHPAVGGDLLELLLGGALLAGGEQLVGVLRRQGASAVAYDN